MYLLIITIMCKFNPIYAFCENKIQNFIPGLLYVFCISFVIIIIFSSSAKLIFGMFNIF